MFEVLMACGCRKFEAQHLYHLCFTVCDPTLKGASVWSVEHCIDYILGGSFGCTTDRGCQRITPYIKYAAMLNDLLIPCLLLGQLFTAGMSFQKWGEMVVGARLQKWGEIVVGASFQRWGEMFFG